MSRLKLIIVLGFGLMFVAGLLVGRSHGPLAQAAPEDPFGHIQQELSLTPTQHEQIQRIWHDAREHADTLSHQIHEADHKRDESVLALLAPEQRPAFAQIQHDRDARIAALRTEIQKTMQEAESSVRALMTPEQQKKFDEIAKQHRHHHGPPSMMGSPMGGGPMMGGWRPWHGDPATAPTTAPAP